MILEQYRGCFERIYIFSPSINVDDGWLAPREAVHREDHESPHRPGEAALRQIIRQHRKITETSKQLKMKQLYQFLILVDDFADSPHFRKKTGDAALDTLFVRGRTWVSTQKLRLVSNAVRVNAQFFMIWLAPAKPAGKDSWKSSRRCCRSATWRPSTRRPSGSPTASCTSTCSMTGTPCSTSGSSACFKYTSRRWEPC